MTLTACIAALVLCAYALGVLFLEQEQLVDRLHMLGRPERDILIVGIDDASILEIGQWPWSRSVYAEFLSRVSSASVVGIDIAFSEDSRFGPEDDERLAAALAYYGERTRIVLPMHVERGKELAPPLPLFTSSTNTGFSTVRRALDGVVREITTEESSIPSFAYAVIASQASAAAAPTHLGYTGPAGTYPIFSFVDVYRGLVPEHVFDGAIVLVGATTPLLHDEVLTPFGAMSGVEYHANVIQFLRSGVRFREFPTSASLFLLFGIVAAVSICVYIIRRSLLLLGALMFLGVLLVVAFVVSFTIHVVLPGLYMGIAFAVSSMATVAYQYGVESRDRRFLRKSFAYYLDRTALEALLRDPSRMKLGGERKVLTVFFSDIRSFTTISEGLDPETLTRSLNEYLSTMTDIIMDHRGVVDRYVGDSIAAFWNAPLDNPNHARDACLAALAMSTALRNVNEHFVKTGRPPFAMGIGINTGLVVVGNIGSSRRFSYSTVGDTANYGSRLEGLTKKYAVECIVSDSTYEAVKDDETFRFRFLDTVIVKGKTESKRIYELMTKPITSELDQVLETFARGRALYECGQWREAIVQFDQALASCDDGPSRQFRERCGYFLKNPPTAWNGVFVFDEK